MADWSSNGDDEWRMRVGGCQGADDDEAKRKAEEREAKKAEVRKRLEEAGKKKSKKGFLTPERKKKLRKLLMIKAAEGVKQQQLKSEQERQSALASRLPQIPNVDSIEDKGQLEKIYNDLFARMVKLEEEKYDINYLVSTKDSEINELSIAVNDLRGKFVKPALKKVSKYDNKFKKMAETTGKDEKQDFRGKLKVVKKENVIEELVNKTKKSDKPEWSKKGGGGEKKEGKTAKSASKTEDGEAPTEAAGDEEEYEEEEVDEEEEEE